MFAFSTGFPESRSTPFTRRAEICYRAGMITPELQAISRLLNEDCYFVVPEYQRGYQWTNEEVSELIDDVWSYVGKDQSLYLGTIILDTSARKKKKIAVVDGQQRLTTILLLLIACREQARLLNATDRIHAIQRKISFTDELDNSVLGMRLVVSPTIKGLFDHMASAQWNGDFPDYLGKLAIRRLKPVYQAFKDKLKALDQKQLAELQAAIYRTQVMRIDIDTPDEAFSIFERTNARGMDLEVADLLKNFLYQRKLKTVREDWQEIVKNSAHSMLRMLKAFYVAYRGYVQKATLYKNLKKWSEEIGPDLLLQRLKTFSIYYAFMRNISTNTEETKIFFESISLTCISKHQDRFTEVHEALSALKQFNVIQAHPVIYAAILCMQRLHLQKDGEAAKQFTRLVKGLESFHYVNTYTCSRIGNEVEQMYADVSAAFGKASKFSMGVERVLSELRKRRASLEEFRESFVQIEYSVGKATGKIAYIFDRLNNYGRKVGEKKAIFYPDSTMFRKQFNVEHIEPQKPKVGAEVFVSASHLNNVGNLTVLTTQLNSLLGNKPAMEKFKIMEQNPSKIAELPSLPRMLKQYGAEDFRWDDTVVEKRAKDLADEAYQKVWTI